MRFQGELSSGMKWQIDCYTGEVEVYGRDARGEMAWVNPYWNTLTEAEQDELAAIGSELNDLHLPEKAKEWAEEYGEAVFFDAKVEDTLEEWRDMSYEEFEQALINANAPSFYGTDDKECAMSDIFGDVDVAPEDKELCRWMLDDDGWLGLIIHDTAYGAAWDACQRYLAEAEDENA